MAQKRPLTGHPPCPKCDMGMIVVERYELAPECQTLECLRCGHVQKPAVPKKFPQAAE
jgi:hypothetical protein